MGIEYKFQISDFKFLIFSDCYFAFNLKSEIFNLKFMYLCQRFTLLREFRENRKQYPLL